MRHMLILLATGAAISASVLACSDDDDDGVSPNQVTPIDAGPGNDAPIDNAAPDANSDSATPDPNDGFTDGELAAMKQLSPLPAVPPDPTNAFANNAAAAVLGQRLFFDKSFSGALAVGSDGVNGGLGAVGEVGKVACVSCHASAATDDGRTQNNVSLGTDYGTRNALPIVNSSFYKWTNWGGRFDSQWSLPLAVAENAKIMKSTRLAIAHMLFDKYKADYDAIFPVPLDPALASTAVDAQRFPATGKPKAAAADPDGAWEGMAAGDQAITNRIFANFGKAIAAYIRLNVSRDAPFDKYVAGDKNALTADAKRGLKVFLGKGKCVECHSGPNLADDQFHNIGVEQTGAHVPATDTGRLADIAPLLASAFNTQGTYSDDATTGKLMGLAAQEINRGQFRTKSLRGLLTASGPFMHAGQLASLDAVVTYYSSGGATPPDAGTKDPKITPLGLTGTESADLVAFLKALDGAPVPAALLTNTAK